jgi:outer membrane receptor protein involved in Fe transport
MLTIAIDGVSSAAQPAPSAQVQGQVTDETGGVLPGVTVELSSKDVEPRITVTDATGGYRFDDVAPGQYQLVFTLQNFGSFTRSLVVRSGGTEIDAVLHLSLTAEVVVTGKRTFGNLADVENPAENLVGIAQSASQGAITAKQLDTRPIMRRGEVLEAVPGLIVATHSGEGKANQYFLRGFNLDHGSDFATTVVGMPANMPTHTHSQGYSDVNFLIPELVVGIQFSKGPYYADQGDFATAGASSINYATVLDRPISRLEKGAYGFSRALFAASPKVGEGNLLMAIEGSTNDGPWTIPDSYKKLNGVVRYSNGDTLNGFAVTAMGYHGEWNATEASPQRAVELGLIDRYGTIDPTDGGVSSRYSLSGEWQRARNATTTRVTAYGIAYDLDLFSNFTFFLKDPVRGDQGEQVDRRFVSGARVVHRRRTQWADYLVQNTFGLQLRNDNITNVALYHTEARTRLETRTQAAALVTSAGLYAQNEIEWTPWLRTMVGLRGDGSRYRVDAFDPINSGTARAGLVTPKGGATIGPWKGTEFYINAGTGFHSNDARGTTIVRDADGNLVDRVTPLVRAQGAEFGIRTVTVPHLQSTLSVWTLRLASELVYNGDIGATEPGPPSRRYGLEWANYYSPLSWLMFDADVAWSRARFTEFDPAGQHVPEAVGTVVSAGVGVNGFHRTFGSLRWRYLGPRALTADNAVRSRATSLVNLTGGYQLHKHLRVVLDVFNVFNAADSDIEYYFASRLPGEPLNGIDDRHIHPTLPRTVRLNLSIEF